MSREVLYDCVVSAGGSATDQLDELGLLKEVVGAIVEEKVCCFDVGDEHGVEKCRCGYVVHLPNIVILCFDVDVVSGVSGQVWCH